jgi:hypothetical protein
MELLEKGEIFAPEHPHKRACQLAVEASCETKPLLRVNYNEPLFLEEDWSRRALKGLARISLMPAGSDYHGLSQAEADYWVGELSGDVEDFFYPILQKHK